MSVGSPAYVVFDVDDTLYLERDYVRSGFGAVERWLLDQGQPADGFAGRAWSAFLAGRRGDTFDVVLDQLGLRTDSAFVERLVHIYRLHRPEIELLPDARRTLTALSDAGTVAIITDGPLESQSAKIEALGIRDYADPIILTASYGPGYGKPHPRAFEEVEDQVGVRGSDCTYVGDNPAKDFETPGVRGWRTVRIRRAGSLHERMPSPPDVDLETQDLDRIFDLLARPS